MPAISFKGQISRLLGWWHGVAVTRFIRSAKLLYAGLG